MSLVQSASRGLPAPTILTQAQWQRLTALHWSNPHTSRLRQAIGDDKLCAAFDPTADCWVLARICRVQVQKAYGSKAYTAPENVPIIWKHWRNDDTGQALSIDDHTLVEYVRRCDSWTRASAITAEVDASDARREAAISEAATQVAEALADEHKLFRRLNEEQGVIHHRKGGHEGGVISSASLWR